MSLKHVDKSNLPAHFDNHQMVQEKSEIQKESTQNISFQQGKENTWIALSQEQGESFLTNVSKEQEDVPICQEEEDTWTVSLSNSTQISPLEIRKGKNLFVLNKPLQLTILNRFYFPWLYFTGLILSLTVFHATLAYSKYFRNFRKKNG